MTRSSTQLPDLSPSCPEAAFAGWVQAYQTPVFNFCYRLLGTAAEAEDAAQETFLRAYAHRDRYDPARPAKTWLMSIAAHDCIDRLRRRRLVWLSLDDDRIVQHPALQQGGPGPEALILHAERCSELIRHMARLAPLDRQVLILHYWGYQAYADIAVVTGLSVSAVKSRLHRARTRLGVLMQQAPARPCRRVVPDPLDSMPLLSVG